VDLGGFGNLGYLEEATTAGDEERVAGEDGFRPLLFKEITNRILGMTRSVQTCRQQKPLYQLSYP